MKPLLVVFLLFLALLACKKDDEPIKVDTRDSYDYVKKCLCGDSVKVWRMSKEYYNGVSHVVSDGQKKARIHISKDFKYTVYSYSTYGTILYNEWSYESLSKSFVISKNDTFHMNYTLYQISNSRFALLHSIDSAITFYISP
jgi:hypothetical protein